MEGFAISNLCVNLRDSIRRVSAEGSQMPASGLRIRFAATILLMAVPVASCSDASRNADTTILDYSQHLRGSLEKFELLLPIAAGPSDPAYVLSCKSGDGPDFDYSGVMDCKLFAGSDDLFLVPGEDPYDSRGRFTATALEPGCISVQEWGGRRDFEFPDLSLTLEIRNPEFVASSDRHAISELDFLVRATRKISTGGRALIAPKTRRPDWYDRDCLLD